MNKPGDGLDEALRTHYAAAEPDAGALARLREVVAGAPAPAPVASAPRARPAAWVSGAWAAGVGLALLAGVLALGLVGAGGETRRVAAEIALNHRKALDSEMVGSDYAGLRERMDKLDFAVVTPRDAAAAGLTLQGGRYCSVGGHLAAQLRLVDGNGRPVTLYQLRDVPDFAGVAAGPCEIDGTRVTLWREGGVLMGLAEPAGE